MGSANKRRGYHVTPSSIGRALAQSDYCSDYYFGLDSDNNSMEYYLLTMNDIYDTMHALLMNDNEWYGKNRKYPNAWVDRVNIVWLSEYIFLMKKHTHWYLYIYIIGFLYYEKFAIQAENPMTISITFKKPLKLVIFYYVFISVFKLPRCSSGWQSAVCCDING